MATYQSVGTGAWVGASSVVITKPTGLAVGDLMIAVIVNNDGGLSSINTPAGWTLAYNNAYAGTGNAVRQQTYTKVADSSDVAASNFTFTQTVAVGIAGAILRISNWGFIDQSVHTNFTLSGNGTITPITGVSPTRINELLILFVSSENTSSNAPTFSGYSIATSDPTWTEIFELSTTASGVSTFACAVATRSVMTATGNASITVGGSPAANTDYITRIIAIAPQVNGSVTPTTKSIAYAYTGVQSAKVNAISDDVTTNTSKYTGWQNETPPTTNWVNETL